MTDPEQTPGEPQESRETALKDSARLVEEVIAPVTAAVGYETILVEWFGAGRARGLRIFIDHPKGVTLGDCTRLSPIIDNALAAAEASPQGHPVAPLLAQPYTLEVSSPGIERPLTKRHHFERFREHRVKIRTLAPLAPESTQRTFHGIIDHTEPDPRHPTDEREGTVYLQPLEGGSVIAIDLTKIRRANLVYEG